MRKQRRMMILFIVPVLLLSGWILYEQALIWAAPEPRWVISASDQEHFQSCRSAEAFILDGFDVLPVGDFRESQITAEKAGDLINRIFSFFPIHDEPTLAEATFPDGQRRLVWYRFDLVDSGPYDMEGQYPGLFIDAGSGEPLLLVRDLIIFDPTMADCEVLSERFLTSRVSRNQVIAFTLLIPYLLISGIVFWLRRRGRISQVEGRHQPG